MKNLKIIVGFIFVINTFFTLGAKEIGLGINANFETLVLKKTLACDVPTNLVHSNITSTTATVGCDPVNGATGYEFAHKINGGSWITTQSPTNSLNLTGLTPSSIYQYKVKSKCPSGNSAYSANNTFTTALNSCLDPTNTTTTAITTTSATFNWTSVVGAQSYKVRYRIKLSNGSWDIWQNPTPDPTGISFNANGLIPSSDYQWQVKTVCSTGESNWSTPIIGFSTLSPCAVPSGFTATNITINSATINWAVSNGAISYQFEYRLNSNPNFTIFSPNPTTNSVNLVGLTPGSIYVYRIKTICNGTESAYSATPNPTFQTNPLTCDVPISQTTTGITINSAIFGWATVPGATSYKIQYREKQPTGAWGPWILGNSIVNSFTATGLTMDKNYQWEVKSVCSPTTESAWSSPSILFTTLNCNIPTGGNTTNITPTAATFNWNAVPSALSYMVQYRKKNSSGAWEAWVSAPSVTNSLTISTLMPSQDYQWQVKSICSPTIESDWSTPIINFSTIGLTCDAPINLFASNVNTNSAVLNWNSVGASSSYVVEYKMVGAANWIVVNPNPTTNIYLLSGLSSSESYTFRIKTVCGGSESNYSSTPNPVFQTLSLTCNPPSSPITNNITTVSATLSWTTNPSALSYKVQYREKEATGAWGPWQEFSAGSNFYNLVGLTPDHAYQWQVKSVCSATLESNWSTPITSFSTIPVLCELPTGMNTINITSSSANLVWDVAGGALGYSVQYRPKNANGTWGAWIDVLPNPTSNSVVITGLTGSLNYQWRVKSICGSGFESAYSANVTFTTLSGCFPPLQSSINTSNISAYSATLNWKRNPNPPVLAYVFCFKKVSDNDWNCDSIANTSGNDTIISAPNPDTASMKIGINQKGPLPIGNNPNISVKLNGLMPNTEYLWKVKSICMDGSASDFSSPSTLFITDPICKEPKNLGVENLGTNKATLVWKTGGGDVGLFIVKYKLASSNIWTTKYVANDSTKLTGLLPGTNYVFKVQAKCSAPDSSAFSPIFPFTTLTPCNFNPPTNLVSSNITSTKAKLSWTAAVGATSYELWYKPVGSSTWIKNLNITNTFLELTGLTPGTTYFWKVKNNCATSQSDFTDSLKSFKTWDECVLPTNIKGVSNALGVGTISWTTINVAINYKIRYRLVGTQNWILNSTAGNALDINFLTNGATYEFQIQSICQSPDTSLWSPIATFVVKTPCTLVPVAGLIANNITENAAKLEWTAISQATQYEVSIRKDGNPTGLTYFVSTNFYQAINLEPETKYWWKVKPICPSGESEFSNLSSFTTIGCRLPDGINAMSNVIGGASISWDPVPGAVSYNIKYRKLSPPIGNWVTTNIGGNILNLTGLGEGKKYEYIVQTVCLAPDTSSWSVEKEFITKDDCTLNAPSALFVTNISANGATLNWTSNSWSPIKWVLEIKKGENGVYDYYEILPTTSVLTLSNLELGTEYFWRVKTICSTGESDWSGQPKFTTGGCATPNINKFQLESNSVNAVTLQWERVANAVDYEIEYSAIAGDGFPPTFGSVTFNISFASPEDIITHIRDGLVQNTKYKFRIRAICSSGNGGYGDYTAFKEIWTRNEFCNLYPPTNLHEEAISSTAFKCNWDSPASQFEIRYRIDPDDGGNGDWNYVYNWGHFATIYNCVPGKKYQWSVRSYCNEDMPPSYWSQWGFVTLPNGLGGEGGDCKNGPDGVIAIKDARTPSEVLIYWDIVGKPEAFYVKYREVLRDGTFGPAYNTSVPGDQHSVTIRGLNASDASKSYSYKVDITSDCGEEGLSPVRGLVFQTDVLQSGGGEIGKQSPTVSNINTTPQKITIIPNPAKSEFSIKFNSKSNSNSQLRIFDLTGKVVKEDRFESFEGENIQNYILENVTRGLYFIEITNGEEKYLGKLVIIE